jgi:hypothetical protein
MLNGGVDLNMNSGSDSKVVIRITTSFEPAEE